MTDDELAPPDDVIRALLLARPTIAVVGASARPERPSHGVMESMLAAGYRMIPVHPAHPRVLGIDTYPDLAAIPEAVEVVDVFRRAEATPDVARQAVAKGAKVLWLQLGVVNWEAHRIARDAGLTVVMDRCIWIEHLRLIG